jgi:hypothetical protein
MRLGARGSAAFGPCHSVRKASMGSVFAAGFRAHFNEFCFDLRD